MQALEKTFSAQYHANFDITSFVKKLATKRKPDTMEKITDSEEKLLEKTGV